MGRERVSPRRPSGVGLDRRAALALAITPIQAGELEGEIVATSFAAEKCRQDRVDDASPITRISCQNMLRTVDRAESGQSYPHLPNSDFRPI